MRTITLDGEPWFVAVDVCRCLSLGVNNVTNHTDRLEAAEKRHVARPTLNPGKGGSPMIGVSESGLYKLIMRSDKDEAIVFQNWVTQEVLPSIRKTGKYALADHGREAMPLPMDIAEALAGRF
nr:BRO family protein [Brevundimonas naejangsanensis]